MTDKVLVVLTNYKRPQNMNRIIQAWKSQSVPTYVVVVDNSPHASQIGAFGEPYPIAVLEKADDVWRIGNNLGPVCRFAPALMLAHDYEYCMFADDDFIPGSRAIETCMEVAQKHPTFATIGHHGRNFHSINTCQTSISPRYKEDWMYQYGNVQQRGEPVPVDLTVRAHFIKTENVFYAIRMACRIINHYEGSSYSPIYPSSQEKTTTKEMCKVHDDFLLCCGNQIPDRQSLILPYSDDRERWIVKEDLDTDGGLSKDRQKWLIERNRMLQLCIRSGWRSTR